MSITNSDTNVGYTPKNILVTGGAGFIGSNFIHRILAALPNVKVVNLDKLTYAANLSYLENLPAPDRHRFIHGDICDIDLVNNLLREHHIDTVVHFAAESHVDRSIEGPAVFIQTNIVGTQTLLEACRKYWLKELNLNDTTCRFHHISTDEVFGQLGSNDPPFDENSPYAPNSPYSASKAAADHLVRAWHHTYGLPITISNCSNNYGPHQHAEKLIPTIIRKALAGESIPIYGDGSNVRDWLHVHDHCDAILTILTKAQTGTTWTVGGECEFANLDLAKKICAILDDVHPATTPYESLLTFVTDRAGHDWRYAINNQQICSKLDWKPSYTPDDALLKTVRWYLDL